MLAGATDADNDYLSTELADPNDWRFHADSVPGSHVILRDFTVDGNRRLTTAETTPSTAEPNAEPSRETLRQAAAVALYHSKARNAGLAPVHCTQARNVKKPRGAKVGTVHVTKGSVLKVRPDISFAVRVSGAPKPASE